MFPSPSHTITVWMTKFKDHYKVSSIHPPAPVASSNTNVQDLRLDHSAMTPKQILLHLLHVHIPTHVYGPDLVTQDSYVSIAT